MNVLLAEMTREAIRLMAPDALAILPTASIEQHGPHLPVNTDTLICEAVALRAAKQAAQETPILVAPTLCYGNSHHHHPFSGVLSLTSATYMTVLTEVLEDLVRSGFRKIMVLNGHGGNAEANMVVGLDMVNRLGHPITIATANYWDVARASIFQTQAPQRGRFPGHSGFFETSVVLALRPDLVDQQVAAGLPDGLVEDVGLYGAMSGATVQVHGAWAAGPGYTDFPSEASAEVGRAYLDLMVNSLADLMVALARQAPAGDSMVRVLAE